MIPIFLGLSAANLLLLCMVFVLGFRVDTTDVPIHWYHHHTALGVAVGLIATLTHVVVYTYFMATCKWLQAATDRAVLESARYVEPALASKSRIFGIVIGAIAATMLVLFTGAALDSGLRPRSSSQVHLIAAVLALAVHVICAVAEYHQIRAQGRLMDEALAILNRSSDVSVEHV